MYDRSGCGGRSFRGRIRTAQLVLCAAALVFAEPVRAQSAPAAPFETLHAMTRQAGVIFTGTVTRVQRSGSGKQAGIVEIEFALQDTFRGVSGSTYVLREWAGLWPATDEPYQVGQRYLMLLHATGSSGLSSPVAGDDGALLIRTAPDGTPETVDLRWIAARTATSGSVPVPIPYSSILKALRTWEAQDRAPQ